MQTGNDLEPCSFHYSSPVRIVGRGQCLYRSASFAQVPANRREDALAVQMNLWSPFETVAHYVVWHGAEVEVWMWDPERLANARPRHEVRQDGDEQAEEDESARRNWPKNWEKHREKEQAYPESVWHPRQEDGLHLVETADGFDLQYLDGGLLRQSQWFAERPLDAEIELFCRLNRLSNLTPSLVPLAWLPEPWRSPATLEAVGLELEPGLLAAAVSLVLLVGVWQEARIWKAGVVTSLLESRLETLQTDVGANAAARRRLGAMSQRNQVLRTALEQPSQADMMVRLDEHVPNDAAKFEFWSYLQGEIRLSVNDPSPDQAGYVRRIERDSLFEDVRVETSGSRGSVIVRAKVPHGWVEFEDGG